jgi:hypothetical protein
MGLGGTLAHTATAPVRIGLSAGELALEVALGLMRGSRRALEGERERELGSIQAHPSWPPPPVRPRQPERPRSSNGASSAAEPPPRPGATVPPAAVQGDAVPVIPPPAGAKEVDDAPVPVGEFAEEGAEDGAGAEVHVEPPWDGYDDMTAAQIAKRLADADRETVATVSLYEGMRRGRTSVVRAADKRLRLLSS